MGLSTPRGHYFGAHPSKPSPNYLGFPSHLIVRNADFPPRAVLTGTIGLVKNQGSQGSCTGHGATSQGERLYRRWKNEQMVFSPAFHYYIEREIEGTTDQDSGAQVVTSLEIAQNGGKGFCPEELMPYKDSDYRTAPSQEALAAALQHPGGSWHSLGNDIANIKACILSDYSFVIGISVYDSFEADHVQHSGLIPLPNFSRESYLGGHEMHSGIAYDDTIKCPGTTIPGAVLTQNSWGGDWGTTAPMASGRGFCWLPYEYLMNPNLTSDIRMQHLGKAW